uniref:peptidylprolyl isomerase n=1 Tax=Odontella aurita TaxID=265563 RepID=A0A7S4MYM8_9STRA|mmetsp:Transcript_40435/g.121824  ORF Transcript_40435/g.121824 Transcript_40435/m.121824 type:complete len:335 (+) Transcript_40435:40-1044(+)
MTILRNLLALLLSSVGVADAFVFAPRSSPPSQSSVRSSRAGVSKAAHRRIARSSLSNMALLALLSVLFVIGTGADAFTFGPRPGRSATPSFSRHRISKAAFRKFSSLSPLAAIEDAVADGVPAANEGDEEEWISLTPESPGAVAKRTLEEGSGDLSPKGSEVSIDYVGTLMPSTGIVEWSPRDAVECWLSSQQGVPNDMADKFLAKGVGGSLLTDGSFTDEFVKEALGIENRIQCKKLSMAARRLAKQIEEYPSPPTDPIVFDSSEERGAYIFKLGAGKAIKGMDLAVAAMKKGEKAEVVCRADYAYGSEGLRKLDGAVVVPPFATLKFEITLL